MLTPWIFEERREKGAKFARFTSQVKRNLQRVGGRTARRAANRFLNKHGRFTVPGLVAYFHAIYRAAYYAREPWKTAMHLTEEIGEVSTEIARMHLLFQTGDRMESEKLWVEIEAQISSRVKQAGLSRRGEQRVRQDAMEQARLLRSAKSPRDALASVAARTLKQEIADVFSWIAALACQLNHRGKNEPPTADELALAFSEHGYLTSDGDVRCRWCGEVKCTDDCLIANAVGAEIYETAAKF